jgi:hypothetical protein
MVLDKVAVQVGWPFRLGGRSGWVAVQVGWPFRLGGRSGWVAVQVISTNFSWWPSVVAE